MLNGMLTQRQQCRGKEAQLLRTCCYFEHKCRLHAYFCFLVQFLPYNAIILWSLLLSGQPPLSSHLATCISQRWLFNGCLTISSNQLARTSIHEALQYNQVSVNTICIQCLQRKSYVSRRSCTIITWATWNIESSKHSHCELNVVFTLWNKQTNKKMNKIPGGPMPPKRFWRILLNK